MKENSGKPAAVKAVLGWTLFGSCIDGSKGKKYAVNIVNAHTSDEVMHELIKRFWEVEEGWNNSNREVGMSPADQMYLEKLQKETKLRKGKDTGQML